MRGRLTGVRSRRETDLNISKITSDATFPESDFRKASLAAQVIRHVDLPEEKKKLLLRGILPNDPKLLFALFNLGARIMDVRCIADTYRGSERLPSYRCVYASSSYPTAEGLSISIDKAVDEVRRSVSGIYLDDMDQPVQGKANRVFLGIRITNSWQLRTLRDHGGVKLLLNKGRSRNPYDYKCTAGELEFFGINLHPSNHPMFNSDREFAHSMGRFKPFLYISPEVFSGFFDMHDKAFQAQTEWKKQTVMYSGDFGKLRKLYTKGHCNVSTIRLPEGVSAILSIGVNHLSKLPPNTRLKGQYKKFRYRTGMIVENSEEGRQCLVNLGINEAEVHLDQETAKKLGIF